MTEEKEFFEGFQVEFDFEVRDGLIIDASVVFNETFDNELRVELICNPQCEVRRFNEGAWLAPSYLQFMDDNSVRFSLLFVSPSAGGGRHQQAFMETLWELACLGFRPDADRSGDAEFAAEMMAAMDYLSQLNSTDKIDVSKYYGLFF